jgi:hypothetical protein
MSRQLGWLCKFTSGLLLSPHNPYLTACDPTCWEVPGRRQQRPLALSMTALLSHPRRMDGDHPAGPWPWPTCSCLDYSRRSQPRFSSFLVPAPAPTQQMPHIPSLQDTGLRGLGHHCPQSPKPSVHLSVSTLPPEHHCPRIPEPWGIPQDSSPRSSKTVDPSGPYQNCPQECSSRNPKATDLLQTVGT